MHECGFLLCAIFGRRGFIISKENLTDCHQGSADKLGATPAAQISSFKQSKKQAVLKYAANFDLGKRSRSLRSPCSVHKSSPKFAPGGQDLEGRSARQSVTGSCSEKSSSALLPTALSSLARCFCHTKRCLVPNETLANDFFLFTANLSLLEILVTSITPPCSKCARNGSQADITLSPSRSRFPAM